MSSTSTSTSTRSRFRETLWFKKGQQDAEAAQAEVAQTEASTQVSAAGVDTLPIEDRYNDDGSLQAADSIAFGLHSGTTQALGLVSITAPAESGVPEGALIREMKAGRALVLAMVALVVAAIGGAALLVV